MELQVWMVSVIRYLGHIVPDIFILPGNYTSGLVQEIIPPIPRRVYKFPVEGIAKQGTPIHIIWDRHSGYIQYSSRNIQGTDQLAIYLPFSDLLRPGNDHRNMNSWFGQITFSTNVAPAIISDKNYHGIFVQFFIFQFPDQHPDFIIQEFDLIQIGSPVLSDYRMVSYIRG